MNGHFAVFLAWAFGYPLSGTCDSPKEFRNLDFEEARVIQDTNAWYPGDIATTNALPGWTAVTWGATDYVHYNWIAGQHVAWIALHDTNSAFAAVLQGCYSVSLQTQSDFGYPDLWPYIMQTGTIPLSAKSIRFYTDRKESIGIGVLFAGHPLGLSFLGGTGSPYYIYGGDVSPFAGQTGDLVLISQGRGGGVLDNIVFSDLPLTPIPPLLTIIATNNCVLVSWPVSSTPFVVLNAPDLDTSSWGTLTNAITIVGSQNRMIIPAAATNMFYRLFAQ